MKKLLIILIIISGCKVAEPIKEISQPRNTNQVITLLTMVYTDSGTIIFVNEDESKKIFIPKEFSYMLDTIENFTKQINPTDYDTIITANRKHP